MRQLSLLNSYSLDCREGHMKKNSLCVCVFVCVKVKGQKNIIFQIHQNLDCICSMTTIHQCVITRRVLIGAQGLS